MTEVSSTSSSSSSGTNAASQALSGNYELFLSLLTTQVQNQDPLDPLDSAEYTNQLVQYSSVEQAIQTNQHLEDMLAALSSNQASSYVNYLGAQVTATGETTMLEGGDASWSYSVSEAASGTVEVRNSSGTLVFSEDVELAGGNGTYRWDGKGTSGSSQAEGAYSISFDLNDAAGNAEPVQTEVSGIVDEVDLSTGEPYLQIGPVRVPVSAVQSVASV